MASLSTSVYEREHAANEKYYYFICGVAGALFAYIAKDYAPHRLDGSWLYWLMPLALAKLTASFACGLRQIRLFISITRINKLLLVNTETVQNMTECLLRNEKAKEGLPVNMHTGRTHTREQLQESVGRFADAIEVQKREMDRLGSLANFFGVLCHVFLFCAFVLILAAKLAQPYLTR